MRAPAEKQRVSSCSIVTMCTLTDSLSHTHTHTFPLYPTGPFTCSLFSSFRSFHVAISFLLASKPISSCDSLSHVFLRSIHEISTLVYLKLLLYVWYISAFCDHFFRNAHRFCVLCVDLIGIHINVCT